MMPTMVKPHQTGPATRRVILAELRRLADAREPASVDALAAGTGLPRGTVGRQLGILRRAGLVETRRGGRAGFIRLTDAGRIATDR